VDGLKRVNDTLGHHQGDRLLAAAARVIQVGISDAILLKEGPFTPENWAEMYRCIREGPDVMPWETLERGPKLNLWKTCSISGKMLLDLICSLGARFQISDRAP
jgi:Diguanylate cyclase, GGDEF domain